MSDDTASNPPRKQIDALAVRRHLFGGVGVDAAESLEASPDKPATSSQPATSAPGATPPRPSTGYRNPPRETRFAKGQSGNPKGRPKKRKASSAKSDQSHPFIDVDQILSGHFSSPMKVREGEQTREMPRVLGYLKMLEQKAPTSVLANRMLIEMAKNVGRRDAEVLEDQIATAKQYIETYHMLEQRALKGGEPISEHWVHPEDITFEPDGVRVRGYYNEESYRACLEIKTLRDALLLRAICDREMFPEWDSRKSHLTIAEFFPIWMDRWLPKRWQYGNQLVCDDILVLAWMSRDSLRRKVQEAFTAIGLPCDLKQPAPAMPDILYRALEINPKAVRDAFGKVRAERGEIESERGGSSRIVMRPKAGKHI